ncbi:MAG: glycosyl hydrolase family 28-related protein, partial [Maribacter sp.]
MKINNSDKTLKINLTLYGLAILCLILANPTFAQEAAVPEILVNKKVNKEHFLPDFSYAGFHFGEKETPIDFDHTINVTDFGAKPNDDIDDSKALMDALKKADELDGYVSVQIPAGKFNISKIIYINRSKTVLRGVGSGEGGTLLYFQRGLRFVEDPPEHEELMEYLTRFDKKQREPENGVDNTFSQYSWSGGFIWVAKKGKFYKSYNIPEYNQPINTFANAFSGTQGGFKIEVDDTSEVKVGETYRLCWFNKDGKE